MSKYILVLSLLLLPLATFAKQRDTSHLRGPLGIGFQATIPTIGMSVRYELKPALNVQGVYGIFGDDVWYGSRLSYGLKRDFHNAYAFVAVGAHQKIDYEYISTATSTTEIKHHYTATSYGGGFALEWFLKSIPELGFAGEVGIMTYHRNDTGENSASMVVGAGIHYYPKWNVE